MHILVAGELIDYKSIYYADIYIELSARTCNSVIEYFRYTVSIIYLNANSFSQDLRIMLLTSLYSSAFVLLILLP
jgi:hypothetical protein